MEEFLGNVGCFVVYLYVFQWLFFGAGEKPASLFSPDK